MGFRKLGPFLFSFGFLLPVTVERVENGKSGVNMEQSDFKVHNILIPYQLSADIKDFCQLFMGYWI